MAPPVTSSGYIGKPAAQMGYVQEPMGLDEDYQRTHAASGSMSPPQAAMIHPVKHDRHQHHHHRQLHQQHHQPESYSRDIVGEQPVEVPRYMQRVLPVPIQAQKLDQKQGAARHIKGVTFDGRTSAPVYGRSKPRNDYLRTTSEEHHSYGERAHTMAHPPPIVSDHHTGGLSEARDTDNEERSSSVASHASNASYTAGDHQVQASHTRGAITASEFNISTGRNPRESLVASEQEREDERLGSYLQHTADQQRSSRRPSRGPEFPASRYQDHLHQSSPRDRNVQHHQQHQAQPLSVSPQRLSQEPGSLSDTGNASLSDKEVAAIGTPPSRSERRARVRDQQSSNERSLGDGGGSSQSLRSQSCGQTSGDLSKKSNSTTQLSLSGE